MLVSLVYASEHSTSILYLPSYSIAQTPNIDADPLPLPQELCNDL